MDFDPAVVRKTIDGYRDEPGALIGVLQDLQESLGWLPEEALRLVSEELGYPMNRIYSVATFYKAFSLAPRGRHVCKVCLGTACHVRGGTRILEEVERQLGIEAGETTPDGQFSLDIVNCVGACAIGPVVEIDGKHHGDLLPSKVEALLKKHRDDT
jgi:NADH-quinone oxidoreductase subunit E